MQMDCEATSWGSELLRASELVAPSVVRVFSMLRRVCESCMLVLCSLFFFQAEDGIRDYKVTGVQTCALPIFRDPVVGDLQLVPPAVHEDATAALRAVLDGQPIDARGVAVEVARERIRARIVAEIGRASCRERV